MKVHVRCSLYFNRGTLLRDLQPSGQSDEQFTTKREPSVELFPNRWCPNLKTSLRSLCVLCASAVDSYGKAINRRDAETAQSTQS
jgi:hypothetical protein